MSTLLDQNTELADTNPLDDRSLLSAYTGGEEAAFESLFKKYFGLVYAIACRQLGDAHLAEEAAQTTFIIFARKARSLSRRSPVCGWLLQTVRFVCKDVLKTRRRRLELEQAFESHLGDPSEPEPESAEAALLEEALLALAPQDQACVLARFFEGRTFKEMGDLFGIREEAAQKRLSRCLKKMRRYLLRRGKRTPDTAIPGLLGTLLAPPVPEPLVATALQAVQAAGQGKLAGGTVLMLAERCLHLLAARTCALLAARVALPLLLLAGGGWALWSLAHASGPNSVGFQPTDPRAETLGKEWSRVVLRAAAAKHKYTSVPGVNDPQFQAYNADLTFAVNETTRIMGQFYSGLNPAQERQVLAEFLTVELRETLALDAAQQTALLAFIRAGLSQRPTLKDSEQVMAQSTQAEANRIKMHLSRTQQQLFDRVYGADGLCLFQFIKVTTAGA